MTKVVVGAGERIHLSIRYTPPELVGGDPPAPDSGELDRELEETLRWWREWAGTIRLEGRDEPSARRSAIVLKSMTYAPTGAVVAAPTTSLPEVIGGSRNWDYRFAWIRDSSFSSRAFAAVGAIKEADAFRAFIIRSAAGHAGDLQVVYGVGGERRLGVSSWRHWRATELPSRFRSATPQPLSASSMRTGSWSTSAGAGIVEDIPPTTMSGAFWSR